MWKFKTKSLWAWQKFRLFFLVLCRQCHYWDLCLSSHNCWSLKITPFEWSNLHRLSLLGTHHFSLLEKVIVKQLWADFCLLLSPICLSGNPHQSFAQVHPSFVQASLTLPAMLRTHLTNNNLVTLGCSRLDLGLTEDVGQSVKRFPQCTSHSTWGECG